MTVPLGCRYPLVVIDRVLLSDDLSAALAMAAEVLRSGGTVLLPTDTVYGVAALPAMAGATDALFRLKARPDRQPLAVLVADAEQARSLVIPPTPQVLRWMDRLWPGALTLVLPRSDDARSLVLGGDASTIGIRCPDHEFARSLAALVGPIATTSANRHGEPTPTTAAEAAASLAGAVGLVVDGGRAGEVASTVVDATGPVWAMLRPGEVTDEQLRSI